jgi:hypothetical protein
MKMRGMITGATSRLKDALDLGSIRGDLTGAVRQALEPARVSVWTGDRRVRLRWGTS